MARRNLAARDDIPADALRQRRDLYALAIGLFLYDLAGGHLKAETAFGSVLPVALSDPHYLLTAAWVGLFYFWFRFWLVSEARPIRDFMEDVRWQAGDSQTIRRIAAEVVDIKGNDQRLSAIAQIERAGGVVPRVERVWPAPVLGLNSLRPQRGSSMLFTAGSNGREVPPGKRWAFWRAWLAAFFAAALRERTFTDYTLPHLFAMVTLIHGVWRHVIAPYMT